MGSESNGVQFNTLLDLTAERRDIGGIAMHTSRTSLALGIVISLLVNGSALATSIGPAEFGPDTMTIDFDSVSGVLTGAEFGTGLTLRSGPAVPPEAEKVPANAVKTDTEFPGAMASPPNKITGAQLVDGGIVGCKFCGIVVEFDAPRAQVGFWVADPDFGQYADFFGPSGSLGTLSVTSHDSGTPFFMGFEEQAGIIRVEIHSVPGVGLGIDNLMFSNVAVPGPASFALLAGGLLAVAAGRSGNRRRWPARRQS